MKTTFLRVIESDDKARALLAAIRDPNRNHQTNRYEVEVGSFGAVPRSPFAYWVSDYLRSIFANFTLFESGDRTARVGLQSSDDFRFMRAWWAVPSRSLGSKWFPFVKGGVFSPFYSGVPLVVHWKDGGREMKAWADPLYNNSGWSRIIKSTEFYFRAGVTWPVRAIGFSPSPVPRGCIFSVRGYLATCAAEDLSWLLAVMASAAFEGLFRIGLSGERPEYVVGVLASVPVPTPSETQKAELGALSRRAWYLKRSLDTANEQSHAFTLPALLQVGGDTLSARIESWISHIGVVQSELSSIKSKIDAICFSLYGIEEADQRTILDGFGGGRYDAVEAADDENEAESETEDDNAEESLSAVNLAAGLLSWAMGVAFGRYDICRATKEHEIPEDLDPFEALPASSPAMLLGENQLPALTMLPTYPLKLSANGILVDDAGHPDDVTTSARAVFDKIFDGDSEVWWDETCSLLDPKGQGMRSWIAERYFEYHLRQYSRSRRKAPIFWQLATRSSGYSLWLYAHRVGRDTFLQLQNDVVGPKLAYETQMLKNLVSVAGSNQGSHERRAIETQEAFVQELQQFLEEIKLIAPLWHPSLDDGIVLTMAPLWRIVQHKPWQKEIRKKWDELAAGKYDWAALAMHLWPERVVPKCAVDCSLAIAHGLDDNFWFQDASGKWKPREKPGKSVDALVRERTIPSVKAALKSLLEAADAIAGPRRSRKTKAA